MAETKEVRNAFSVQMLQDLNENGVNVPCTCSACGKIFVISYRVDGSYEYITEPCECETDFEPCDGYPSISEWLEKVKKIKEDITNGEMCMWP